jgi:DNA photolyase
MNSGPEAARGRTTVVLFTRDLRLHDHPALSEAASGNSRVVPLFALDDALLRSASPNRLRFPVAIAGRGPRTARLLRAHRGPRRGGDRLPTPALRMRPERSIR